jgi:hypothetical protein
MAVEIDQAVPLLDVADHAFSVRSAQVRRARQASTPGTSYGLAVLRHDQVARLTRHPKLRQRSSVIPHRRPPGTQSRPVLPD